MLIVNANLLKENLDVLEVRHLPLAKPDATQLTLAPEPTSLPKNANVILESPKEPPKEWPPDGLAMFTCRVPLGRMALIRKGGIDIEKAVAGSIIAVGPKTSETDTVIAFQSSKAADYAWAWYFRRSA